MFAREGFPFIFIPVAFAIGLATFGFWILAAFLFLVAAFMAFFFRDPRRVPPDEPGVVVSAADGTVTRIEAGDKGKLVSVFLSPLDVHINRSPIGGNVIKVEYTRGRKIAATNNEASFVNERNSLTIEGERMTVVCTQIAGILARRIVCRAKEGDNLAIGQKFGMIKFSSRTDVLMPSNVDITIKIGDKVRGGLTIIGRMPESVPPAVAGGALSAPPATAPSLNA
jgi:phosphatidylserine decarboxylase